jgi:hypothetical protein
LRGGPSGVGKTNDSGSSRGPAVIERIGLRFVDLIEGQDAEDLPKFIEPPPLILSRSPSSLTTFRTT